MDKAGNMSFLQHLEELRWHLLRSLFVIFILSAICFLSKSFIFDVFLFAPKEESFITYRLLCELSKFLGMEDSFCLSDKLFELQNRKMSGQFASHIWISLVIGFLLSMPYFLWELWRFIKPALNPNEKKMGVRFIGASSVLISFGFLFGYYVILPMSINFLGNYSVSDQIKNEIDLSSYINIVASILLSTCGLFQLPLIIYFFARLGLITSQWLKKYRRHSLVVVLILSAFITPPDVASQVLVTLPIILLYELSIWVVRSMEKKNA